MSRSLKKYAAGGVTTSRSEKDDKHWWHRSFRRVQRQKLWYAYKNDLLEDYQPKLIREMCSIWCFNKDGHYFYQYSEWHIMVEVFSSLQFYANCHYDKKEEEGFSWHCHIGIENLEGIAKWLEKQTDQFEYRLGFYDPWDFITEDMVKEYARQKYKCARGKNHLFSLTKKFED